MVHAVCNVCHSSTHCFKQHPFKETNANPFEANDLKSLPNALHKAQGVMRLGVK